MKKNISIQTKPIMLLEDDSIDSISARKSMQELDIKNQLITIENGEQGMKYLTSGQSLPWLILLDLNMPKMNGLKFLARIKEDHILRCIPVVVFTTSKEQNNLNRAFQLSISGYIIKSVNYEDFLASIKIIFDYWSFNELPEIDIYVPQTVSSGK